MSAERLYRCTTPAHMARRVARDDLRSDTVTQFAFVDDPDEVVVEVDTNGPISPVTGQQVVVITVLPHHAMSQDVAERIWSLLEWEEIAGDDWEDPADVNVQAKGWDCRVRVRYE